MPDAGHDSSVASSLLTFSHLGLAHKRLGFVSPNSFNCLEGANCVDLAYSLSLRSNRALAHRGVGKPLLH